MSLPGPDNNPDFDSLTAQQKRAVNEFVRDLRTDSSSNQITSHDDLIALRKRAIEAVIKIREYMKNNDISVRLFYRPDEKSLETLRRRINAKIVIDLESSDEPGHVLAAVIRKPESESSDGSELNAESMRRSSLYDNAHSGFEPILLKQLELFNQEVRSYISKNSDEAVSHNLREIGDRSELKPDPELAKMIQAAYRLIFPKLQIEEDEVARKLASIEEMDGESREVAFNYSLEQRLRKGCAANFKAACETLIAYVDPEDKFELEANE